MTRTHFPAVVCLLLASLAHAKTNLVFILTDNQGAWTLGCYGNHEIRTPHIDQLAAEGIRFTRAFASNAVCSPTRATFLTGLLPSQHGIHSFLDQQYMVGPKAYDAIAEFTTLPQVLHDAGYTCGLVGKWHLGDVMKPHQGFTTWFTKPDGSTREMYDVLLIDQTRQYNEPRYTTDVFTEHAVQFIEANRDKPFFLYLAYNGPYALGNMLKHRSRNRHADFYDSLDMTSFPLERLNPRQYANLEYAHTLTAARRVACEVSGIDDGVGQIMATLKRLGVDENTLVVYASDQGWSGGHGGYYGMGDHTFPLTCTDKELQIPLIFRHPRKIAAGSVADQLISTYDFMPTVLSHLGLKDKSPRQSPGRDFSPVLRGEQLDASAPLFYEFEDTRMIRTDKWKYIERHPYGPNELYDLAADPDEQRNVIDDPRHTTTFAMLQQRLHNHFDQFADPKFDLWRHGKSKAKLHSATLERYLEPRD
jgi:arylsulfatase A-like enzyme